MDTIDFNKVFGYLQDVLPAEWKKIVFYAILDDGRYSMKYFVDFGDRKLVDSLVIPNINSTARNKAFIYIYNEIEKKRLLPDGRTWTTIIMKVTSDGNFTTKFGFDNTEKSLREKCIQIEQKIKSEQ